MWSEGSGAAWIMDQRHDDKRTGKKRACEKVYGARKYANMTVDIQDKISTLVH
jgi:tRNA-binding EMAP/Myf-like protein